MKYLFKNKWRKLYSPFKVYFAYDRTQTLFKDDDISPIRSIGSLKTNLNFDDISDRRAESILSFARAKNKKILVLWSGGIDSTVALVAMLKVCSGNDIVVGLNQESIDEYPLFYDKYIHNKLEEIHINFPNFTDEINVLIDSYIILTGEIGDQLFGSDQLEAYGKTKPKIILNEHWTRFANGSQDLAYKTYGDFVGSCPRPIEDVKDFWWWMNYSLKYQCVAMRAVADVDSAILDENVFHFFDSDEFNDWAVSTPSYIKYPGLTFNNYKKPAKDYIYKFTQDNEYLEKKIKVASLCATLCVKYSLVDVNWVRHK